MTERLKHQKVGVPDALGDGRGTKLSQVIREGIDEQMRSAATMRNFQRCLNEAVERTKAAFELLAK